MTTTESFNQIRKRMIARFGKAATTTTTNRGNDNEHTFRLYNTPSGPAILWCRTNHDNDDISAFDIFYAPIKNDIVKLERFIESL